MLLAYFAILGTALAGLAGLAPWSIAAGAIALAAVSQSMYGDLYRRGQEAGLASLVDGVMLRSLGNAIMAAVAAYGLGWILRLL